MKIADVSHSVSSILLFFLSGILSFILFALMYAGFEGGVSTYIFRTISLITVGIVNIGVYVRALRSGSLSSREHESLFPLVVIIGIFTAIPFVAVMTMWVSYIIGLI